MRSSIISLIALAVICFAAVEARSFESRDSTCCESYCYSTDADRPQYLRMNTKTAYQFAKGGEDVNVPAGCTPTKFWLIARHGTRLPSASKIEKLATLPTYQAEIIDNYANGRQPAVGALCDADLELLTNWRWDSNITTDKDEYLTVQGWNDLKGIAQHYKAQFPSLFGEYSEDKFYFRHTATQRTQGSYRGFVEGLFGEGAHEWIPDTPIPDVDTLLRPHDTCSKWLDQEAALEKSSSELSKFEDGNIYLNMAKAVSTKAGYSSALKANRIKWMFEMCYYNLAWDLEAESPWCSLFTMNEAKIFEYAKDLEEWNLGGSATTVNKRLSCDLVQDMVKRMETLDGPTTIAYFAHSTTLQLFLTGLGFAHLDTPLKADNYEEMADRAWISSKISCFSTNVAVVRYDCADGVKIQFIHNERPLQLDWCVNGLCDWEDVKAKYAEMASATCSSFYCTD